MFKFCKKDYNNIIYKTTSNEDNKMRKKIVILTNNNGGGHISATNALKEALEDSYNIEVIDILKDRMGGESIFLFLLKHEHWYLLKILLSLKGVAEFLYWLIFSKDIEKDIINSNPDIVISTFPVLNLHYFDITRKLKVPFIVIPTDFNTDDFEYWGIPKLNNKKYKDFNYNDFYYFISNYNNIDIQQLKKYGVEKNVKKIGYPIRKGFYDIASRFRDNDIVLLKEMEDIKQQYNIKKNDKILLISFGAKSINEKKIIQYINALDEYKEDNNKKIYIFVCCGSNEKLLDKVSKYKTNDRLIVIPLSLLKSEQMAKYMALADLSILKPGGSTTAELLSFGSKQALLNADTTISMKWEMENMKLLKELGIGECINKTRLFCHFNKKDFLSKIKYYFDIDCNNRESNFDIVRNNFYEKIQNAINEIFVKQEK